MAVKKTKTTKQTQSKELKIISGKLDVIENLLRDIYQAQAATPIQITANVKEEIHGAEEGKFLPAIEQEVKQEEPKQNLINQSGEVVELTYDTVKAEANTLVTKDEHGAQLGFAKAREIIIGYGVTKLEEVGKEHYSEIVAKFRKAINEWK